MIVFPSPFQIASPFYDLPIPFGTLALYVLIHQNKIMEPLKHLCENESQELSGEKFSGMPNLCFSCEMGFKVDDIYTFPPLMAN